MTGTRAAALVATGIIAFYTVGMFALGFIVGRMT